MDCYKYDIPEFAHIVRLKEKLLNTKLLPDYIFCDNDWKLMASFNDEAIGKNDGVFHKKLCSFLQTKNQTEYYLSTWFIFKDVISYAYQHPFVRFNIEDTGETYERFWDKEDEHGMKLYHYSAMYFLFNDQLDWFCLIDGDVGITIIGVKTNDDITSISQIFKEVLLPKKEIKDNVAMVAANFRENFWQNYYKNFIEI
jgi:hypothetical protein